MTTLYEKNLIALAARYPSLHQQVLSCDLTGFELFNDGSRSNVLVQGQPLYNEYHDKLSLTLNPKIEDIAYPKLLVFYGLGLGSQLSHCYEKINRSTEFIYLIEKSLAIFSLSLKILDWTKILADPRVVLFVGYPALKLRDHIIEAVIGSRAMFFVNVLVSYFDAAAISLDENYYRQAIECISETPKYNVLGDEEDAFRGFMNVANNLAHASGAYHHDNLLRKFAGVPAVVVSSGPSLTHSLPWLKEIQGKAVIACADSALKTLLANGITPNFVGCLERVAETRFFFEDLPPLPNTYLLCCPVVYPDTYQKYPGPILHLMRYQAQLQWFFPEGNYFQAGSSVATMNMLALELMDCSPIYLVGQDLAYDRSSKKTHAVELPETVHRQNQLQRQQSLDNAAALSVTGNDGNPILTTKVFNDFRDIFERRIRLHNLKVYNVIPENYGAKIDSAIRIDPTAIEQYFIPATIDPASRIKECLGTLDQKTIDQRKQVLKDRFNQALAKLGEYQKIALQVLDSQSEFVFLHHPLHYYYATFKPLLYKIEQIGSKLTNDEENFYHHFFWPQTFSYFYQLDQQLNEVFAKNPPYPEVFEHQFNHVVKWFRELYFWAGRMKNYLDGRLK